MLLGRLSKHFCRRFASDAGEDYLKVHKPAMYWFPSKKPTADNDEREIGPYPQFPQASNDPAGSFQFRTADAAAYTDRQNRRQIGEPVPEEAEFQGLWNVDIEGDYSVVYMLSAVGLLFGSVGAFAYFSSKNHDPLKSPRLLAVIGLLLFVILCFRLKKSCRIKRNTSREPNSRFHFGRALKQFLQTTNKELHEKDLFVYLTQNSIKEF